METRDELIDGFLEEIGVLPSNESKKSKKFDFTRKNEDGEIIEKFSKVVENKKVKGNETGKMFNIRKTRLEKLDEGKENKSELVIF